MQRLIVTHKKALLPSCAVSPIHTSDADEPPTVGGTNIHAYEYLTGSYSGVCRQRFVASAELSYMAEVAHATGPRFRGPAPLGKIIFCARVNCGIASLVVFTTAILHWHNILQHIRVNIRALVEFTNAADENSRRK